MDLYIEHALERTVRIAFSGQELGKSPVCSEADCTHIRRSVCASDFVPGLERTTRHNRTFLLQGTTGHFYCSLTHRGTRFSGATNKIAASPQEPPVRVLELSCSDARCLVFDNPSRGTSTRDAAVEGRLNNFGMNFDNVTECHTGADEIQQ